MSTSVRGINSIVTKTYTLGNYSWQCARIVANHVPTWHIVTGFAMLAAVHQQSGALFQNAAPSDWRLAIAIC